MRRPRVPNHQLRSLLDETGWSGQKLVNIINHLGAEAGLTLSYQRASTTQWLSGIHPRNPVPELLAEAFTRALGRSVTPAELGLTPNTTTTQAAECPISWADSPAVALREATVTGHDGRPYRMAGLAVPTWPPPHPDHGSPGDTPARPGTTEVRSATAMLRLFSDTDMMFGGGHARIALASYLRTTIAPWLASDPDEPARRELLTTAARLCYLCGFMCFDDELHGTAQHYYLTSLRLSAESGDTIGYALTLRALSVQARSLGHVHPAVDLAEAAVRTATNRAAPRVHAFLLGQLAVAHAAAGDSHEALTALAGAEKQLSHADRYVPGVAAYHEGSLAHQQAATTACLGDRRNAIKALKTSIRHRPTEERRSRAITLARLAELLLVDGRLDQACHTWQLFLDDYRHLTSRRADTAMKTLRAHTRSHQNHPAVRALLHRATALGQLAPWEV